MGTLQQGRVSICMRKEREKSLCRKLERIRRKRNLIREGRDSK
jgi:hypothetical protein